jgi:hypothetical protein
MPQKEDILFFLGFFHLLQNRIYSDKVDNPPSERLYFKF